MLFKYKNPTDVHVKFQRIIMGWLAIAALFMQDENLVLLFFALTALGMITGTEYSIVSLVYKIVEKLFRFNMVKISSHHARYYQVNISVDMIDHLLRIIASGSALLLFYFELQLVGWVLMAFLSIFMMLSAYFGFCLSALSYIFLQKLRLMKSTSCNADTTLNTNCTLAQHCFTPYKRCDSCHVDITECLGTKFNTLVLIIGLAMSLFLFVENKYMIQANIVFIMGLIFWLGYQINYNTDDLAESNNANIQLNKKLKAYNLSLEEEVQKRTSEIEHLVTHDQLTGIFNRYWFEKKAQEAIESVHENKEQYTMAFLDLDKFKYVNDNGGHLAGDELLRRVTKLISENIDDEDIFARLGGDEFAILFKNKKLENVIEISNKLCKDVDAYRFEWADKVFQIGVSIGVVDISLDTDDLTDLFHKSDTACYNAKKSGRNRVSSYEDI